MNQHSLRWRCAAAFVLLAALRISAAAVSSNSSLLSFLFYTQTGRVTAQTAPATQSTAATEPTADNSTFPTQITQPSEPEQVQDAVLSFSPEDLSLIGIRYSCDYRPDVQALLTSPLSLELIGDAPTVLIVHTHTTESYTGEYKITTPFRTLDETQNMIAIGEEVARVLELRGIRVIHDKTVHDYPGYNTAYAAARNTIKEYLAEYPTIQLVLDLHRDASDDYENQLVTASTVGGQRSAQLMLVAGSDGSGLYYPDWEVNLALALKLTVVLEQENPGLCRPVTLRNQRFNLDLTPGSLLVEVGAAGNTLEEAMIAANALANAIAELAHGSE